MGTWPGQPTPLDKHMASLGWPGCTCPHEWGSAGILYGVSCGNEWHRMLTVRTCPDHGEGTRFWHEPRRTAMTSGSQP